MDYLTSALEIICNGAVWAIRRLRVPLLHSVNRGALHVTLKINFVYRSQSQNSQGEPDLRLFLKLLGLSQSYRAALGPGVCCPSELCHSLFPSDCN